MHTAFVQKKLKYVKIFQKFLLKLKNQVDNIGLFYMMNALYMLNFNHGNVNDFFFNVGFLIFTRKKFNLDKISL